MVTDGWLRSRLTILPIALMSAGSFLSTVHSKLTQQPADVNSHLHKGRHSATAEEGFAKLTQAVLVHHDHADTIVDFSDHWVNWIVGGAPTVATDGARRLSTKFP
eukprot:COSAG06_NODE_305_length_17809_cov_6.221796_9_plen_105_part_00